MTDRLKPCPLCDGEAEWKNGHIVCKECGLSFRAFSYDLTNKKWNTRKPMDRIVELLEELLDYSDIGDSDYIDNCNACINQAIEIVKAGGKGE